MRWRWIALVVGMAVPAASAFVLVSGAGAEQASNPALPASGLLDTGEYHSCVVLSAGTLRCWGLGSTGQLGYGNTSNVGDSDTPASAGAVNFGPGVTVKAIAAGGYHTCAIVNDGSVRCWGFGGDGRLGYGNTLNVLTPSKVGPVFLGTGRTATAITAGAAHTCAILDNGSVLCWGYGGGGYAMGGFGRLGYGTEDNVGDTPATTPGLAGPVYLGAGRTAVAISAGGAHTCAILDNGGVECWGLNSSGQLGYGNTTDVGDTPTDTPGMVGPVDLGGHKAVAISAGGTHTCVIVDDGSVYCWGLGVAGQLGYGNTGSVGDASTDTPAIVGPVNLGGHTAVAISAGDSHTCTILDDGSVRCWGYGANGRLGYPTLNSGNPSNIFAPPSTSVDLGAGRTAIAISAGGEHTCALLDNRSVRCWGFGGYGQLGYCSMSNVGETNTPGSVGPVNLEPGDGGAACPGSTTTTAPGGTPPGQLARALRAQAARARALRACRTAAGRRPKRDRPRAEAACVKRYRRIPGRVSHLSARAISATKIRLSFAAPGTAGSKPPAAESYVVKQSSPPGSPFAASRLLCHGRCRFHVTAVGTKLVLTITHLRRRHTYSYTVQALDNVTATAGPRSTTRPTRTL